MRADAASQNGVEIGVVEIAAIALGLGADHGAVEAVGERVFENLGGELSALQGNGGKRRKLVHGGCRGAHMLVHEAAPIGTTPVGAAAT